MFYWIRVGEEGDYQAVDDIAAVVETLNSWRISEVTGWVAGGIGIGLETTECHGYDFVSLFWGDDEANVIRSLNGWERAAVETGLVECLV